jgi:hypothetical protein
MIGRSGMSKATGANVSPVGRTGYDSVQLPTLSAEQMNLFQKLLGGLSPGLEKGLGSLGGLAGGDQSQFSQLEAPALRQHHALLGNIGARFSGMGTGAQNSSGFQNATGAATTDLAERLQSQRMNLQQQALKDLMSLSKELLGTKLFDTSLIPQEEEQDWLSQLLGAGLPIAGAGLGAGLGFLGGGPAGALTGAQFGGSLGSAAGRAFR